MIWVLIRIHIISTSVAINIHPTPTTKGDAWDESKNSQAFKKMGYPYKWRLREAEEVVGVVGLATENSRAQEDPFPIARLTVAYDRDMLDAL